MSSSHPYQALLSTERLSLVPLSSEHLSFELALDSNPSVTRYLFPIPRTPDQIRDSHERRLEVAIEEPGFGYWIGILNDEPIGLFMLTPPEGEDDNEASTQGEIGYRLLPQFGRRGLGTAGSRAVMRYAFLDLGLERIFAQTMAVNTASRATMVKLGMRFVRSFYMEFDESIAGAEEGEVEYAITRSEWQASQTL